MESQEKEYAALFEQIERDKKHIFDDMEKTRALSDECAAELTALIAEFKSTHAHLYDVK